MCAALDSRHRSLWQVVAQRKLGETDGLRDDSVYDCVTSMASGISIADPGKWWRVRHRLCLGSLAKSQTRGGEAGQTAFLSIYFSARRRAIGHGSHLRESQSCCWIIAGQAKRDARAFDSFEERQRTPQDPDGASSGATQANSIPLIHQCHPMHQPCLEYWNCLLFLLPESVAAEDLGRISCLLRAC